MKSITTPKRRTRNCLEGIIIVEFNLYDIGDDYVKAHLILVDIYSKNIYGGYLVYVDMLCSFYIFISKIYIFHKYMTYLKN